MPVSLSMPLYVNPNDVIERMQLNAELNGIVDVVSQAIMASELHVQALLDGNFIRQSQDCMFFLDSEAFSGIQPGGVFRVELPSGFVRTDTPVVMTCSDSTATERFDPFFGNIVGSDGPFGDFSVVDSTLVKIDYNRGYILLSARTYKDKYLRVQCDTGYEPGTTPMPVTGVNAYNPASTYAVSDLVVVSGVVWICKQAINPANSGFGPPNLLYWSLATIAIEQLPQPVYEAILSFVPVIFDAGQTTNRNQEAEPQYKKAGDHAALLLKQYERLVGFAFRPLWK